MNQTENNTITGKYQTSAGRDYGFFIPEGKGWGEDSFVPPGRSGDAWDGDLVEARLTEEDTQRPGRRYAEIVRIIERGNKLVIGTTFDVSRDSWLEPDNPRLPKIKLITNKYRVRPGQKVAITIYDYGSNTLPPLGYVRKEFGTAGSRRVSMETIFFQFNIEREFPKEVLQEANAARKGLANSERRRRLDWRKKLTITIDGASSKDLDDAVSLERSPEGNWVLGVHIADVGHYVPVGSAMDREAFHRGTSVYFADQVIPMFPEQISNGICSLNPGVDRLTISCMMTFSPKGEMLEHSISPSVIHSNERMNYKDCNLILAGKDANLEEYYAKVTPMLRDMAALSKLLRARRFARGGLDLEVRESEIICDDYGRAIDVKARTQGESEQIIEEFMLIANETVAKHLNELQKPAVYRVHEKPSQEKLENLRATLAPMGFALKDGSVQSYQKALETFRDDPRAEAVRTVILRSLMKAHYSTENSGHFGLAAPFYCHFTSPIRRYPDLVVHRCLNSLWDKQEQNPTRERKLRNACQRAAEQSSAREIAAQTAERAIEKLYFAEYMERHTGEEFDAAVSGVNRFGLFAVLENGVEGFVPVERLPGGYYGYEYDREGMRLVGREKTYGIGKPLRVACVRADPATGRIDFQLSDWGELPF